ncbi:type I-E CRISPR-associated protein Cse1/CasA [Oceanimonas marisflavi]|uniref:type I-E CRISPR-associated protein Cse1/CasA n=1 Tax=Oceanimonas marisflavi TaxID=2059724 RepID=UPI000D31B284|nr:type I-E CRISPR-associated protein Cse1/CasA [Oceanimonas marisflavi]
MNLLTSRWLSYRLRDGSEQQLPLTAIAHPDVVDFALPRADFHGAAYQFAIGLLQTVMAPQDKYDWHEQYLTPPDEAKLAAAFAKVDHAFDLDGDGPRFMQDLDPLDAASPVPVSGLLIEAPGGNTLKLNTDHFIKRGIAETLSPEMAALALFTLQINAPSGGQGHRTGLRGGGPLTTLVLPHEEDASLWQKLWLNVQSREFWAYKDPDYHSAELFPWLGETRISKNKGSDIYAHDVHPLAIFWAMPRRIRLLFEQQEGACQLSLKACSTVCRQYRTSNYGNNYIGTWLHPLTHYRSNPKKPNEDYLSTKGQSGGIQYKQWHSLSFVDTAEGSHPAQVVQDFLLHKSEYFDFDWGEAPRLWAFGFDMDNMKARGWYNSEFPLIRLDPEIRDELLHEIKAMQTLAQEVLWHCRTQIKAAWFDKPVDAKGDTSHIDLQFWQRTQNDFFQMVAALLNAPDGRLTPEAAARWLWALSRHAKTLFDDLALSNLYPDREMYKKIRARRQLTGWLAGSKRIRQFSQDYRLDTLTEELA